MSGNAGRTRGQMLFDLLCAAGIAKGIWRDLDDEGRRSFEKVALLYAAWLSSALKHGEVRQ